MESPSESAWRRRLRAEITPRRAFVVLCVVVMLGNLVVVPTYIPCFVGYLDSVPIWDIVRDWRLGREIYPERPLLIGCRFDVAWGAWAQRAGLLALGLWGVSMVFRFVRFVRVDVRAQ